MRGFHVEFQGLDTLTSPDLRTTGTGPAESAWLEVLSLVDVSFRPLIQALQAAGVRPPDLIGHDLAHEGEVVGMIEFGWSAPRLAVCEDGFEVNGWDLLRFDPNDNSSLTAVVATLVSKLEEKAA
jgi:hypothetical protein